jgi:hypothetical protein
MRKGWLQHFLSCMERELKLALESPLII